MWQNEGKEFILALLWIRRNDLILGLNPEPWDCWKGRKNFNRCTNCFNHKRSVGDHIVHLEDPALAQGPEVDLEVQGVLRTDLVDPDLLVGLIDRRREGGIQEVEILHIENMRFHVLLIVADLRHKVEIFLMF